MNEARYDHAIYYPTQKRLQQKFENREKRTDLRFEGKRGSVSSL